MRCTNETETGKGVSMLFENFYNELMYYLQKRLDTLTEERNASDDAIHHLAYDSASSAIIGVIVQMQKIKLRSALHEGKT